MPSAEPPPHVVALPGSLRRGSVNAALLRAAARVSPDLKVEVVDDALQMPLFNEDLEPGGLPDNVLRLARKLESACGVIIATPEYNQSIPGPLKNALDWMSRCGPHPLAAKPVAILGASSGPWGTRHAQAALRHTLAASGALVMPSPQVYVRDAPAALSGGEVSDPEVLARLADFTGAFSRWVDVVGRRVEPA